MNACNTCVAVNNGLSTAVPATLDIGPGELKNYVTEGLNVGVNGSVRCLSVNIIGSGTYDINLSDASAVFLGNGNRIRSDKIAFTTGSTLVNQSVSDESGDEGVVIRGQLQVGYYADPRELVVGGGDSHVNNMKVFTETPGGVFTDRTTAAMYNDGITFPLFDGTAINNKCYFGLVDTTITGGFPGIKIVDIQTAIVLGGGALTWEYWNGEHGHQCMFWRPRQIPLISQGLKLELL